MKVWGGKQEIERNDQVRVQWRCGLISDVYPAHALRWKWRDFESAFDIVAYEKLGDAQ